MADDPIPPLPRPEAKDLARQLGKAAVAGVPVAGGPGAELYDLVVPSSFNRRRDGWYEHLADVVNELTKRGVNIEDLVDDEEFVTAMIQASRIALGTHIEQKLELLKNAVVNMALPERPPDFLAARYLSWVDELSPEHFVVLTYAADPEAWFAGKDQTFPDIYMGAPISIFRQAGVGVDGDVLDVVLRDLGDRALANTGSLGTTMTGQGARQAWATDLGRQLIDFVRLI